METNKIYQGSALDVLKTLPNESINCVMTSPKDLYISYTFLYSMSVYQYIAGIIDGEAYVGIKRSTWGMRNNKCKNPIYSERIQIKMKNPDVLKLFKKEFGGRLYHEKRIYQSKNGFKSKQPMWLYLATDKNASIIAKKVFPYLLEKKEQIGCLIKLRKNKETKLAKTRGSPSGKTMDESILKYREELFKQCKKLNSG